MYTGYCLLQSADLKEIRMTTENQLTLSSNIMTILQTKPNENM